jgi:hypothetical protein
MRKSCAKAVVRFYMAQICILGLQLPLVRHMDQQIESVAVQVAAQDGFKLLSVKAY